MLDDLVCEVIAVLVKSQYYLCDSVESLGAVDVVLEVKCDVLWVDAAIVGLALVCQLSHASAGEEVNHAPENILLGEGVHSVLGSDFIHQHSEHLPHVN